MKVVISSKGKSFQKEIDGTVFYGKKIGDIVDGSVLGLNKYELEITGGSDKQGFPMRRGVHGTVRKKILLSGGVGYRPKRKGVRRRKSIRGEIVSEEIVQLNLKVIKEEEKSFENILKEIKGDKEEVSKENEEKSNK